MLTTTQETIGICLFELPDKDQTVIQRVVTFGASQGKPYVIQSAIDCAQVIITPDNVPLPTNTALVIRIGDDDAFPSDLLLARPLLVTRVMRTLDDAAHILATRPKLSASLQPTVEPVVEPEVVTEIPVSEEIAASTPEPELAQTTPPEEAASPAPIPEQQISAEETAQPPVIDTPVAEAEPETPVEAPAEAHYTYTALVVDDSAAIRKQLEIELRNAQIKADFAETGEEALEKSGLKQYDIIFLDIIMPGIDGYEVCRQMRSRKTMKKTPIIMLSGKTSPLDEVQGVIAGASTYLTKPVKHEQFQQTLTRVSKWLTNFAR